jgi:hypothetical protein
MNRLGNFAGWLSSQIAALVDLAITHWVVTAIILIVVPYTAGKQRRVARR